MTLLDLQSAINDINNHIGVLNDHSSTMSADIAAIKVQIEWITKAIWLILGATLTALAGVVINLFKKK